MPKFLFKTNLLVLITIYQCGYSGSVLSSRLIGSPFLLPNTRSMSMGGLAIANPDSTCINTINPADLSYIKNSILSLHYLYEYNHYQDQEAWSSSDYSNFNGFGFHIGLGHAWGIGIGLSPLTRIDYHLEIENSVADAAYIQSLEGRGGLNRFSFSLSWRPYSNLSLGLSGHYLFGEMQEASQINFLNADFNPTQDSSSTLDTRSELTTTFNNTENKGSIVFPDSWGFGLTWLIQRKGQIGIEIEQKDWSKLRINNLPIAGARESLRFGLGGQLQISQHPQAPYRQRIAYRIGLSHLPYASSDVNGKRIDEIWGTFGLGFPVFNNNAQIDIAIGIGKRGAVKSNGISENLFRLLITLSGGEKWFIRHY